MKVAATAVAFAAVLGASVAVAAAADRGANGVVAYVSDGQVEVPATGGGLPALPTPEPAPDDPFADVPIVPIGSIEIPKIGLEHTIYEGVELTVIDEGPGHWPGSAEPGEWGNTVIAGHRVTHSRPFRDIDVLAPGDEIILRNRDGIHRYAVTDTRIVDPAALWIVDQRAGRTLTLFACHPPGSAAQRIVVSGELVESTLTADAPAA